MQALKLSASFAQRADVAAFASDALLLFRCTDADTVIVAATMADHKHKSFGVWLRIDETYPAQLAARDVATLANVIALSDVVIEASADASQHAEVVEALLTAERVDLANEVATLTGAYNRPAPPAPVRVWSSTRGQGMVNGGTVLTPRRVESNELGEFAYFE